MFDEFMGLPAHPLLVHAAVVFGPLLVASVVAYSLVPPLRRYVGWVTVLLSVAAPFSLWFAVESGEELKARQIANGAQGELVAQFNEHQNFGDAAWRWAMVLGALGIATVLVTTSAAKKPATPSSRAIGWGLAVLTLIAAGFTGYYVFKTGDSGARMVWS